MVVKKDKYPEKDAVKMESAQVQEKIDEKTIKEDAAPVEAMKGEVAVEVIQPIDEAVIETPVGPVNDWKPITELGRKVKSTEISDINAVFDKGYVIKEPQIIDMLLPNLESDLLMIGQSKGKFGGGQRRAFKQTQKKTAEGNKPKFATYAVIGNRNGFVGLGYGKSKETVPGREKALRNAKLGLMRIVRGCGSWQCGCKTPHSIPFKVEGKCGSCKIVLMPAAKGTGLKVEKECQKILALAGFKDVLSKTFGQTGSKINLIKACEEALKKLTGTKVPDRYISTLGMVEGNKVS